MYLLKQLQMCYLSFKLIETFLISHLMFQKTITNIGWKKKDRKIKGI